MASRARRDHPPEAVATRARVPMSDQDLELFYQKVFLPLVRRATWKHKMTKEDAADIVQDAFVLAIQKIDSGRNPKAWLVQVVDHLAANLQRKVTRRTHLAARWAPPASAENRGDVGASEVFD